MVALPYEMPYFMIRNTLRTGDVVFFDGKGVVSGLVRMFAGYPSHAAVVEKVYRKKIGDDETYRIRLIESTSQWVGKKWQVGVQYTFLSDRVKRYKGNIWVAPLSHDSRFRISQYMNDWEFCVDSMRGKRYDFWQAFRKGWAQKLPSLIPVKQDFDRLFCSELVVALMQSVGILPLTVNASTVSPRELAQFAVYACKYYQIAGPKKAIPKFNTVNPWRI
jgi:hypothetical protein